MGEPLYFHHPSSLEHDTGPHPERIERIPAIEGELERRGWLGYARREAPEVPMAALTAVHPEAYVESVRATSERGGAFDIDTISSPGSYEAALRAAGGACALVESLLREEADTGFSALRPPGHHAEPASAMGFCLFNNVAVAAQHAVDSLGAERVLVFDWDVHHGNGTNDIFHSSAAVLYASIHQWPFYPGTGPLSDTGSHEGEGRTVNLPVPAASGEDVWLSLVEHVVVPVARAFRPDLILISAGFDAHRDDPIGGCLLDAGSFAEMATHLRRLGDEVGAPVGGVLEGGYDLDALAASVAATLEALTGNGDPRASPRERIAAHAAGELGRFWRL
jgi:acetoin utilization deacetylase AcuC-like enzyme